MPKVRSSTIGANERRRREAAQDVPVIAEGPKRQKERFFFMVKDGTDIIYNRWAEHRGRQIHEAAPQGLKSAGGMN